MRFLIDAQLPPALARWLSACDHPSLHVADIGMQAASDRQIWDLADKDDWVIITKDEDFAQRKALTTSGPQIVWLRWPNGRRAELLERFAQVLPQVIAALERGENLVEVR